jgi:hypothetical protein
MNTCEPVAAMRSPSPLLRAVVLAAALPAAPAWATSALPFPRPLDSYAGGRGVLDQLALRIDAEPFNLVATLIFLAAITHTFMTGWLASAARRLEARHREVTAAGRARPAPGGARLLALLGEIETVFGIWGMALLLAIVAHHDWGTAVGYMGSLNFTEPMFVVVIMTLAATRPILRLAAVLIGTVAGWFGGGIQAWWWTLLTVGPLLGSFITEPAAMTITALLFAERFYALEPGTRLKYATLGLLFVNLSVGGTLTHFAAPPVLMVAGPWGWDTPHMLAAYGWKAMLGIIAANALYFLIFRTELAALQARFAERMLEAEIRKNFLDRATLDRETDIAGAEINRETGFVHTVREQVAAISARVAARIEADFMARIAGRGVAPELARRVFRERYAENERSRLRGDMPFLLPAGQRGTVADPDWDARDDPVPPWVTAAHVGFMAWTVANAHHPELFVPGLLFFLGFAEVTAPYQNRIDLKTPMLVGFFLGGLVVHGGLQGWWIAPLLVSLGDGELMWSAALLSAFNDNAAITYLATLVPNLSPAAQYAVVAGAVSGGGLTVIANAPNPAGLAILKPHFADRFSPGALLAAALAPTLILLGIFAAF